MTEPNDRVPTVKQFPGHAECSTERLPGVQGEVARRVFEQFLEALCEQLPVYLFTTAKTRVIAVGQERLSDAIASGERPACTLVFEVPPFQQRIQLELGRSFASAALESVLGASPETVGSPRESLTGVDLHILSDLIDLVAEKLREAWLTETGRPLRVISKDTASALDGAPMDDYSVVTLTAETEMRNCTGSIRLLVPSVLLRLLSEPDLAQDVSTHGSPAALVQALSALSFEVEAVLSGATIRVRDLLGLQPGKILELPHKVDGGIECQVNGVSKFRGELVSSGKSLGFHVQS